MVYLLQSNYFNFLCTGFFLLYDNLSLQRSPSTALPLATGKIDALTRLQLYRISNIPSYTYA